MRAVTWGACRCQRSVQRAGRERLGGSRYERTVWPRQTIFLVLVRGAVLCVYLL